MGGGGGEAPDMTIRHSAYLETAHKRFLDHDGSDSPTFSIVDSLNAAFNQSPYATWTPTNVSDTLFGTGYYVTDFPALFDMFGKFMAGLDIEILWDQILEHTTNGSQVGNLVSAHSAILQDELDSVVYPKLLGGLRDINSVMSSTFIQAKANLQSMKARDVSKFTAELQYKLIEVAKGRWDNHLNWNKSVTSVYGEFVKLYLAGRSDFDAQELEYKIKDKLWNVNLYDHARAMLGALGSGTASGGGKEGPSQTAKAISGAMSGAAMGAMVAGASAGAVGGPIGIGIGAALGLAASFL